ncbi:MAG: sigma-70 family RNA polymerase sigma factor [Myxococcota bacterium]
MPSDAELLTEWRAGEASAGQALFERYFDQVTRFFINKIPDDHEDLIQETFIACVKGRDRLRRDTRFRSYLFSTAYNVLKKHYGRICDPRMAQPLESQSAEDLSPGPSTLLRNDERARLLLEALRRIPLEQQVVLEMTYWEGMSSAEIGEVLGLPSATVRTRAYRGRDKLLDLLSRAAEGEDDRALDPQRLDALASRVRGLMDGEL